MPQGELVKTISKFSSMHDEITFEFLNEKHQILNSKDWNSREISKLWLYNLHYFDDLNSYNNQDKTDWHEALLDKWIKDNPFGNGNGWEPYPTSLRIVNWIKYFITHQKIKEDWLESLAIQTHYLHKNIEFGVLGNHLIANAKALIYSGLFFKGQFAEKWLKKGEHILIAELSEQILEDGGHFELSPMYHSIVLEDLLDLYNLYDGYGVCNKQILKGKILSMISWLENMTHPNGEMSFFNDATLGVAPTFEQLLEYVRNSQIDLNSPKTKQLNTMTDSGYSRVEMNDYVAIIDHGNTGPSYLGGHSHADTLSFELSLFSNRVIVNSGVSIYGGMLPPSQAHPLRAFQRGTLSHSTVTLDGQNSSEVWGAFRLGRRASITEFKISEQEKQISLLAAHDGYRTLRGGAIHQRVWDFSDRSICITDEIHGQPDEKIIQMVLPMHPNVRVINTNEKSIDCEISGNNFAIEFQGDGSLETKDSEYFPEFGKSIANIHLVFEVKTHLPYKLITRITW